MTVIYDVLCIQSVSIIVIIKTNLVVTLCFRSSQFFLIIKVRNGHMIAKNIKYPYIKLLFNEPIVPVEGGYLYNFHYPDINDAKRGFQYAFNTILANTKAIKLFKEQNYNGEIGIVLKLTPSYPRSENEEDKKAALIADLLAVNYYLPRRVKTKENIPNPNSPFTPEFYFDNYEMLGRKMNPYRGWEIYPEGYL